MRADSVKVETGLNVVVRGTNAIVSLYLATVMSEIVAAYFAYIGCLNVGRGLDFGYSFYQRHSSHVGRKLAFVYDLIYLILPIVLFYTLIAGNIQSSFLLFVLSTVLFKWLGTAAHICNRTWLIPMPMMITNIYFLIFRDAYYCNVFLVSSVFVAYVVLRQYRFIKLKPSNSLDNKLILDGVFVFIPSFIFLFLSEYVFIFLSDDIVNESNWIGIYLKLNATMVSVLFLFNDIYWNRYGNKIWQFFHHNWFMILVLLNSVLVLLFPLVFVLLFTNAITSIISGYLIRQRVTSMLLLSGCIEAVCYFIGLKYLGLDSFFTVIGISIGCKLFIMYYGSLFFGRQRLQG